MPLGGIFLQGAPWQAQAEEGVELAEISQFLQGCGVVYALLWQRGNVVWGPVLPTFWFQQRGAGTYPEWDIPVASVGCSLAAGDSLLLAMALPEISGVGGFALSGQGCYFLQQTLWASHRSPDRGAGPGGACQTQTAFNSSIVLPEP